MRQLGKYLAYYKKESILGPLFKLLEAGFELIVPLVVVSIIDVGIKNQDIAHILKMGGVMVLLGLIGLVCSITAQYFAARAAVGCSTKLRENIFIHLNQFSYSELDTIGTSTLITRLTSDVNQVQTGINLVLRLFLRSPFIVFGSMIMAFSIDVKPAFVFVIVIPVLSVIVFGIMCVSMPWYRRVQGQLDRVLLHVRENLSGVRVVRAFNQQKREQEVFHEESRTLMDMQLLVGRISGLLNPLTYVVINLGIIFLIWVSGRQVYNGVITQGEVVALVNYMSQILVELIKLANLIITVTKSLACMSRINRVLEEKPGMTEGEKTEGRSGTDVPKVEFRNVSMVYKNAGAHALEHISFRAMPGETIGIIGGTGSGKSTLVNLIPRFYDAENGTVLIDGQDVREYTFSGLRERIGIVPQKAVLFSGTIRENMKWGRKDASDEEIWEALEIAQAREVVESKEGGLDVGVLQGGSNLSGGQRQRLTIARALVRRPEILILDDSASALDYATDASLRKAIRETICGATVFLVSQRAATIRNADKIIVLEDGAVAGIGTHEELLMNCEVYREICMSQFSEKEGQKHGE